MSLLYECYKPILKYCIINHFIDYFTLSFEFSSNCYNKSIVQGIYRNKNTSHMFPKWIDQIPAIYQITQAFYQFHFIAKNMRSNIFE